MAQLQDITQQDFSGGTNTVSSPFILTQKQVQRTSNLVLDEHGAMRTRDGYAVVSTSPNTTDPLIMRGVLNLVSGTSHPYAGQSNGTTFTFYKTAASPWTSVGTVTTSYMTPQAVTVLDQEFLALGYVTPRLFDGTNLSSITSQAGQTTPPGARHVAFHLGYVWLWNTNSSTTTLDGPSSLRSSDTNVVNSWPNASQTFISKDDGQIGMGLASYTIAETGISPISTLIAFKNYSAYQISGVFGASNFSVQKIKSDMGCVAPRTIQFVSGFGIVRLGHKGFALYNGVDDRLISEEIRPWIFGRDDITGIDLTNVDRSFSAQSQNPPLYIAACPVGSSTALSRLFVYDLVRRAWTICSFPVNFNVLTLFTSGTASPVVHGGTSSGGQLVSLFNGATTDNGTAVSWSFRSRAFTGKSLTTPSFWRRTVVDSYVAAETSITCQTTLGGFASTLSQSQTYALLGGAATDSVMTFDILRTSPWVYVDVSGSGVVRIRGLSFHVSPKPGRWIATGSTL